MEYPTPAAIAAHLLSGLHDANARVDQIEAKVVSEIAKLPAARRGSLTTDAIFANAALATPSSSNLRTMTNNPAFKIEPAISQLRRAEAAYIEAHDAYLKEPSDRHVEEMRWALERLAIARKFFAGLIAALPPAKRVEAHLVKPASKAVAPLQLASFSTEEQHALRLAILDRPAAIAHIDRIIAEGRASGKNLRIIHAYLIDPTAADAVTQWLVDAHADVLPQPLPDLAAHSSSVEDTPIMPALPGRAFAEVPPSPEPVHDPAIDEAIAVLDDWLNHYPVMIGKFRKENGLWRFDDVIKSRNYQSAYRLVATNPKFQRMIEARKTAHRVGRAEA